MKIGRFRVNFSPWRRRVGKNLMRHPGKRIYRRFRISNQIFGSISGSGDIARSLDTTFCRFWPKSQLCGWISREPDFCWTCGFRRLFIDTLYYRFQSKKDGSSWLDFQKMSKNHSKMYIFVLYGWTKFFFENRASSLFYIYQSLTSCKKSRKSNDGKYENFWDRQTDRQTDWRRWFHKDSRGSPKKKRNQMLVRWKSSFGNSENYDEKHFCSFFFF